MTSTSGGGTTPVTMNTNHTAGISTLTTYKDGDFSHSGTANAAITAWNTDTTTGNLTSKVFADGSSISYFYNASGQLYQRTQAMSGHSGDTVTATYGYTADGVQNSVTYTQSGRDTINYSTAAFDVFGNPTLITESITPAGGTSGVSTILEQFGYDDTNHQLNSETFNYATNGTSNFNLSLSYSHTDATFGNLTGLSLNRQNGTDSGTAVAIVAANYSYNAADQLSGVTGTSGSASTATTFTYNDGTGARASQTTTVTGGDLTTTYQYNASNGHLTQVKTMLGSTLIEEDDYTYGTAGSAHYDQIARKQVIQRLTTNATTAFYVAYGYDSQNQLTSMITYDGFYGGTGSHATLASQTWAFDAQGNRTDLTSDIMNQYTADENGHAYTYDARGNLTGTYAFAYTYDQLNRLTSAAPADHSQSESVYSYDSMGRMTSQRLFHWNSTTGTWDTASYQATTYLYDGWNLLAEIDAGTGQMKESFTWDPTKAGGIGGLLAITTYSGGTVTGTYVPYFNAHGDVVGLIDKSTGSVSATYSYQAYGQVTITGNGAINPIRWQTAMQLDATDNASTGISDGVYVIEHRTLVGERWMERDPSGQHGGQNGWQVIDSNDPVNRVDPDGMGDVQNGLVVAPPDLPVDVNWTTDDPDLKKAIQEFRNGPVYSGLVRNNDPRAGALLLALVYSYYCGKIAILSSLSYEPMYQGYDGTWDGPAGTLAQNFSPNYAEAIAAYCKDLDEVTSAFAASRFNSLTFSFEEDGNASVPSAYVTANGLSGALKYLGHVLMPKHRPAGTVDISEDPIVILFTLPAGIQRALFGGTVGEIFAAEGASALSTRLAAR